MRSCIPTTDLLVVTETGYGKRVAADEFRRKHRGGQGVGSSPRRPKTGKVAAVQQVTEADEELMLISAGGQVLRTEINTINRYRRSARGVIVMRLARATGSCRSPRSAPDLRAGRHRRRWRRRNRRRSPTGPGSGG